MARWGQSGIREPVAGPVGFYPTLVSALEAELDFLLDQTSPPPIDGVIHGALVPHAGYRYSGGVAAALYAALRDQSYSRVFLFGPAHHVTVRGVAVDDSAAYRTPLGDVGVDQEAVAALAGSSELVRIAPEAHLQEHAIEVQLPFIQRLLPGTTILPALVSDLSHDEIEHIAATVAEVAGGAPTLLLASSDLSHYYPQALAEERDAIVRDFVGRYDAKGLLNHLLMGNAEMCGSFAAVLVMMASELLGCDRTVMLSYATSGTVTGDYHAVVGYLSAAFVAPKSDPDVSA